MRLFRLSFLEFVKGNESVDEPLYKDKSVVLGCKSSLSQHLRSCIAQSKKNSGKDYRDISGKTRNITLLFIRHERYI